MDRFGIIDGDDVREIYLGRGFKGPGGEVNYPANWLELATPEERFELGIRPIVPAAATPAGKRSTGLSLSLQGNVIVETRQVANIDLDAIAAQLQDAVRARRWMVETAGVEVAGQRVASDEKAQAKITGALKLLEVDDARTTVNWEAQPGVWVELDQTALETVGIAVGRHVQAAFDRCKALSEQIEAARAAGDRGALLAIDINSGWPS